ncbi:hypothetical protein [Pelagibacterium luteolum]|nr:hypothetical protein [Pelagibacterium luteolum]
MQKPASGTKKSASTTDQTGVGKRTLSNPSLTSQNPGLEIEMQNTNSNNFSFSEAAAERLGYELCTGAKTMNRVLFVRFFDADETFVLEVKAARPDRDLRSYWLKTGHKGPYRGPLEVDDAARENVEELDCWDLTAAFARDLGNEAAALRCEEYRRRNLRDIEERKAAAGGRWVKI